MSALTGVAAALDRAVVALLLPSPGLGRIARWRWRLRRHRSAPEDLAACLDQITAPMTPVFTDERPWRRD